MNLDGKLERAKVDMQRLRVDSKSKAEARANAARVQADIEYEKKMAEAESEKDALMGEAKRIEMEAQAEQEAFALFQAKREHKLKMLEKEVIMNLAQKINFNLIGDSGDVLVNAVMNGKLSEDLGQE